ncbi:potassium channel family protein [Kitasatospora sp. NPDC048365]|uniref:potassium channel family protein n=1 Tax=Kitasatospora sp. NPDC048365 TaxID=3364050 RepID=UPI0037224CDC
MSPTRPTSADLPTQATATDPTTPTTTGAMVVCGDDALALRLAQELTTVYGRPVTVVIRSLREGQGPQLAALAAQHPGLRLVEAADLASHTLAAAGVREAAALALTGDDDQANIQAALRARRLNPGVRLVLRVYNRKLGRRVGLLLDRTATARERSASTAVLSTSFTAAPALVAAAVSGGSVVVNVGGRLLRATELPAGQPASGTELTTLAALPAVRTAPAELLPDATEGRRLVLEMLGGTAEPPRRRRHLPGLSELPFAALFSPRLRWAFGSLALLLLVFAGLTSALTGAEPLHTAYLAVLDVIAIADPATDQAAPRKVLQILTAVSGLLLMPLLTALALEALGTFRAASTLRRPPRRISGHVVLLGLGRVGSRVLDQLWELDIPVVCVESDPTARGVARARAYGVPVVLGDATQEGVLEAARIGRSSALIALTGDSSNLEAAVLARESSPELRVVLGLFDDDFATELYRALRDSYPEAETRSHSVSFLSAPAFAAAMMGRQVLGALAVGRQVVLIAAVDVAGHPELAGRTVADAEQSGAVRIIAVQPAGTDRPEPRWRPARDRVLREGEQVVVAASRAGLGAILGHSPGE